jgi:hypothetical protein
MEPNKKLLVIPVAFRRTFSYVIQVLNTTHCVSEASEEGHTSLLKCTVSLGVFL